MGIDNVAKRLFVQVIRYDGATTHVIFPLNVFVDIYKRSGVK